MADLERKSGPKLTREEMLDYINNSGLEIPDIRGHGPGTGFNPDITQLPDESLGAIYQAVKLIKEEGEEGLRRRHQEWLDNQNKAS